MDITAFAIQAYCTVVTRRATAVSREKTESRDTAVHPENTLATMANKLIFPTEALGEGRVLPAPETCITKYGIVKHTVLCSALPCPPAAVSRLPRGSEIVTAWFLGPL